jgi:hypothetical protein
VTHVVYLEGAKVEVDFEPIEVGVIVVSGNSAAEQAAYGDPFDLCPTRGERGEGRRDTVVQRRSGGMGYGSGDGDHSPMTNTGMSVPRSGSGDSHMDLCMDRASVRPVSQLPRAPRR